MIEEESYERITLKPMNISRENKSVFEMFQVKVAKIDGNKIIMPNDIDLSKIIKLSVESHNDSVKIVLWDDIRSFRLHLKQGKVKLVNESRLGYERFLIGD